MGIKNLDELLSDIQHEFPDFKLVPKKDSRFMKLINVLLLVVTFGRMKSFMTTFITTIKHTVYTHASWDAATDPEKVIILRHERVHMQQAQRHGFFAFALLYLLWPLPMGWAKARARFEMEAYEETMTAMHEFGGNILSFSYRAAMIDHFVTAQYGWMCLDRKWVERWYDVVSMAIVRTN